MTLKDLRVIKVISKHGEVKVVEVVGVFGVFGLFWLLGKFIEIDCLLTVRTYCLFAHFDEIAQKIRPPAAGGGSPRPPD